MLKRLALECAVAYFGFGAVLLAQNPATAMITTTGHPQDYSLADIQHGSAIYAEQCFRCHGADGTGVSGVDFRTGKFHNADTDRQLANLILTGIVSGGMPPFALDGADLVGIIAYLRNINSFDRGTLKPGNAEQGRVIFETKGNCLSCHSVKENGSRRGPDLSDIGSIRSAGIIERTLLDPNLQLFPIDRPVHIVTGDGKVYDGRRLNEDTYTVQIADQEGNLHSFTKSDLREFKISTQAAMPSYKGQLSTSEISDLIAYLLTLKGQ